MSGGFFEYNQFRITSIADDIQKELDKQGLLNDWGELAPTHPLEIQEKMKEAIAILRSAAAYAHTIDYYLSGDIGEDAFSSRLSKELDALKSTD